jgi:MFS family permease
LAGLGISDKGEGRQSMSESEHRIPSEEPRERSTAELVSQLTELVPRLVREEIGLAQRELQEKGKRAGIGAGLFGGGGVVALYGGGALVAAAILGLAEAVPGWLAALFVAVVLLAVAGVLALVAKRQVTRATPPVPEQALREIKKDVKTVKESAKR